MKPSERLYNRYEYLAKRYAGYIFNQQELGLTYDDLVQEFRIKIFTSIKAYGRRWAYYRNTGYNKPVPLVFYLEAACKNFGRDITCHINPRRNIETTETTQNRTHVYTPNVRMDDLNYDMGVEDLDARIDSMDYEGLLHSRFVINDVDLLEGLSKMDGFIFSAYLCGYQSEEIAKVYLQQETKRPKTELVSRVITKQKRYLRENHAVDLLAVRRKYTSYQIEND